MKTTTKFLCPAAVKFILPAATLVLAACGFEASPVEETGQSQDALSASSVVGDALGDSTSSAPYNDVVHAKITQQGNGTLFFLIVLAGPVPASPSEADLIWPFHLETDPNSAPGDLYVDYVVRVRWFNGAFVGQVIRRATGTVTAVPFRVDGATVKLWVDPAVLGDPSTFGWNAAARPGQTVPYADFAPDCLTCLTTWTSK